MLVLPTNRGGRGRRTFCGEKDLILPFLAHFPHFIGFLPVFGSNFHEIDIILPPKKPFLKY